MSKRVGLKYPIWLFPTSKWRTTTLGFSPYWDKLENWGGGGTEREESDAIKSFHYWFISGPYSLESSIKKNTDKWMVQSKEPVSTHCTESMINRTFFLIFNAFNLWVLSLTYSLMGFCKKNDSVRTWSVIIQLIVWKKKKKAIFP